MLTLAGQTGGPGQGPRENGGPTMPENQQTPREYVDGLLEGARLMRLPVVHDAELIRVDADRVERAIAGCILHGRVDGRVGRAVVDLLDAARALVGVLDAPTPERLALAAQLVEAAIGEIPEGELNE